MRSILPLDHDSLAMSRIYVAFYATAAADKSLAPDMDRYIKSWQRAVETCVREVLIERNLPTSNSREIANFLAALADGYAVHATIDSILNEDIQLRENPRVDSWIHAALHLAEISHAPETPEMESQQEAPV